MKNKNILTIFLAVTVVLISGTIYFVKPELQKGQLQYDRKGSHPAPSVPYVYFNPGPAGTPGVRNKGGPLPDLIITNIASEENAIRGTLWHAQIKNVGGIAAQKPFQIILSATLARQNLVQLVPVTPKAAGSFETEINGLCVQCSVIATFEAPRTSDKVLLLESYVDNNDAVVEANERNNAFVLKNSRR